VPTARRSRTIAAPAERLWDIVSDPHHLPRWWPRVARVEGVAHGAFTEVMLTAKGKTVRADFDLVEADEQQGLLLWSQRVAGTPFARLLRSAETEVRLATAQPQEQGGPAAGGESGEAGEAGATVVTIELRQVLSGLLPRFGSFMVRRAAVATIDEALEGLERISA
jgi:uncharacterized protein YndB with AHSA1/START domain